MSRGETHFFRAYLAQLELDKTRALEAQRVGALPEAKLEATLARYRGCAEFITYNELILAARRADIAIMTTLYSHYGHNL